jgi:hypothetical protein
VLANPTTSDGYAFTLLTLVLLATLLTSSISVWAISRPAGTGRGLTVATGAAAAMVLTVFYLAMLGRSPFPASTSAGQDPYSRIMQIAQRIERLIKDQPRSAAWEAYTPAVTQELAQFNNELFELAKAADGLPFDLSRDEDRRRHEKTMTDRVAWLRTLGHSLEADAKAAIHHGDPTRATHLALTAMRLRTMLQGNGVEIDRLMGNAMKGYGERPLVLVRRSATEELCDLIIHALAAHEREEEPFETALAREIAYCQRMYGWQARFGHLLSWLVVGSVNRWPPYQNSQLARIRHSALCRLLMTEFAIRRYQIATSEIPDTLDELSTYLPVPPTDPFTARPLIYRRDGDTFVLYSVGTDGRDQGGRFPTHLTGLDVKGYDLDSGTLIRGHYFYSTTQP